VLPSRAPGPKGLRLSKGPKATTHASNGALRRSHALVKARIAIRKRATKTLRGMLDHGNLAAVAAHIE
jgi:hypothetical protein